jgi:hypothetical protein
MDISPTVLSKISLVMSLIALFVSVGALWVTYRLLKRQKEPEQTQAYEQIIEQVEEQVKEQASEQIDEPIEVQAEEQAEEQIDEQVEVQADEQAEAQDDEKAEEQAEAPADEKPLELPYLLRVGMAEQRSDSEIDPSLPIDLSILGQTDERFANAVYLINKDNVPAPDPVHLSIAVYTPSRYSFEPDANALTDLGTKIGKSLHGKALKVGEYVLKTTEHMTLMGYVIQDTSILLPEVSETVGYFMKCDGVEFVKDKLKIPKPE